MESGEHMPDKPRFVRELARVCAPGGRVIVVTWCHRRGGAPPPLAGGGACRTGPLEGETTGWGHAATRRHLAVAGGSAPQQQRGCGRRAPRPWRSASWQSPALGTRPAPPPGYPDARLGDSTCTPSASRPGTDSTRTRPTRRVLREGESLSAEEASLLDSICAAYYLPAWCSVADYEALFRKEGLVGEPACGARCLPA